MPDEAKEPLSMFEIDSILWERYLQQGEVALRLQNPDEAAHMFDMALNRGQCFGADDWRTITTMRRLAISLIKSGQLARAQHTLIDLIRVLDNVLPSGSPQIVENLRLLARVLEMKHDYEEAARVVNHLVLTHPDREQETGSISYRSTVEKLRQLQAICRHAGEDDSRAA
jgi:hypothetical protein